MKQDDVLEPDQSFPREVAVVHHWLLVVVEEKPLVDTVLDDEKERCDRVENWHSTRVEESDSENDQHVRVPELKHEFVPSVDVFKVLLDDLSSLPIIA